MSEYTAERVERAAGSMRVRSSDELEVERMLLAYAATLRQQAERGDGAVSDEVVGAAWNAYEHSMSTRERFTQAYKRIAMRAALEAVAPLLRAPAEQSGRVDEGLFQRACEVVHHETDCPAIGGNGDADCRCDAVPFLRDLNTFLTKPTNEDAVDRAVDAFHDVYDGVSHNLRDAVRHVLATAALAQNMQGEDDTLCVDRGALKLALNVLRRAGKTEVAEELERGCYTHAERARVPGIDQLQRYYPSMPSHPGWQMSPDSTGEWVLFSDVQALLSAAPSHPEDEA